MKKWGLLSLLAMAPFSLGSASLFAVLSGLASLLPFYCLYRIAELLSAATPDLDAVQDWVLYAIFAVLLRWTLMSISHCLAHLGAFDVICRLRLRLLDALANAPLSRNSGRNSADLRKVVMDDVGSLEGMLAHTLPDAAAAIFVPLFTFAYLLSANWLLALAALAPLPIAVVIQILMLRGGRAQINDWNAMQTRMSTRLLEYLRVMPMIRSFGLDARSFGQLADTVNAIVTWVDRHSGRMSIGWAWFVVLLSANLILVAPLGAWLHARGEVSASTVVLFLLIAPLMLQPLMRLTFALGEQQRRNAALARISALLENTDMAVAEYAPPPLDSPHTLELRNVCFTRDARTVLDNVTFTAVAGQTTAIVGASGAGKTTLLRLIACLDEISDGDILLAGRELRDWPLSTLLERLGVVPQEVFLFRGSIRDNLLLACPSATEDQLCEAAKLAQAHAFIERLPEGYDTLLGERGAQLSGGERQRLTLARAILRKPCLLLLDEATAHADNDNANLIHQALLGSEDGCTVVMTTHRLRTAQQADHIIVLDAGCVVGQGHHDHLLAECHVYQKLWQDQQSTMSWTPPLPDGESPECS